MFKTAWIGFFILTLLSHVAFAEKVIWEGSVAADGTPTKTIDLTLGKKYQIFVNGSVNLGKWIQAGKELADDAGFEYNDSEGLSKTSTSLKNSSNIPLETQIFNPEHFYKSKPFIAKQNKLHFWVFDTDYGDNSGSFNVKLIELNH